jgi:hypothetical protein
MDQNQRRRSRLPALRRCGASASCAKRCVVLEVLIDGRREAGRSQGERHGDVLFALLALGLVLLGWGVRIMLRLF